MPPLSAQAPVRTGRAKASEASDECGDSSMGHGADNVLDPQAR